MIKPFINFLKKKLVTLILIVLLVQFDARLLVSPKKVEAAFNEQINYQGKLTDTSNGLVSDGTYHMLFKLYTSATGGSAIWSEDRSTAPGDRISVTNGLFSVMLGSSTPLTALDFNQTLYLGIEVGGSGGTASWDGEMSPRKIIGAVPAAFEAKKLGGLNSSQFLRTDATNSTSTSSTFVTLTQNGSGNILDLKDGSNTIFTALDGGNIGIGTTSPYATLSVEGSSALGNSALAGYFIGTTTATSTLAGGLSTALLSVTSTSASSTFANGINLTAGCFAINGTCLSTSGGGGAGFGKTFELTTNHFGVTALAPTTSVPLLISSSATSSFTGGIESYTAIKAPYFNATSTSATSTLPNTSITNLSIGGDYLTDLVGTGLQITSGALTLNATGNWTGTFDGQEGSYYLNATNLTNFGSPFYTYFSATTTDALAQGSTNLYWSNTLFDNRLSATTTLPNITTLANLTTTGALTSGSIASGFGTISTANNITTTALGTFGTLLANGSTTLQNFTALNATTSNATTSALAITGITSSLLKTTSNGSVVPAVAGTDYIASTFGKSWELTTDPFGVTALAPTTTVPIYLASTATSSFKGGLDVAGFTAGLYARAPFFTATSTTASSTFKGLSADLLQISSTTASSTFANGINLTAGCFAISGTCLSTGGGFSFGEAWRITTNVFGESSLAPTTTQNIAVNGVGTSTFAGGLSAFRQISAPYFQATSTSANSVFQGSLSIGTTTATSTAKLTVDGAVLITSTNGSVAIGNTSLQGGGLESLNIGIGNTASGSYASSFGRINQATSTGSVAVGTGNKAGTGISNVSLGITNTVSAIGTSFGTNLGYSSAVGVENAVTGADASTVFFVGNAFGYGNIVSARYGSAFGNTNTASGNLSSAFGRSNTASGSSASAFGTTNTASGSSASAFGVGNIASASDAVALGTNIKNGIASSLQAGVSNAASLTILSTGETRVPFITATSTGATSTFKGLSADLLQISSTTATSTFANGINLTAGCFAISGTCVGGAGGSGTVNSGTTGQIAYYAGNGTAVSATSTLFINTTFNHVGIGTTTATSTSKLTVYGAIHVTSSTGSINVGTNNSATGTESISIGLRNNVGTGPNNTAIGTLNTVSGIYSGVVGSNTAVGSSNSITGSTGFAQVFGYGNTVTGTGLGPVVAIGSTNTVTGNTSSAIGMSNSATTTDSSAFGRTNKAGGLRSSAFGYSNSAFANDSSAVGQGNIVTQLRSSAVGYANTVSATNGAAFGYQNTVSGTGSSAVGVSNTVSGVYSSSFGKSNTVSGNYSVAIGYQVSNTIANSAMFGASNTAKLTILSTGETQAPYFTATSTGATSTFKGLSADLLQISSTTATSTFANGINLTAGCFAISGTCVGGAGGSGTVNSGTAGFLAYYPGTGTTVDDAGALFWDNTNSRLGVGTSSPYARLSIAGDSALDSNVLSFASSSATTLNLQYLARATSTIVNNSAYAWTIATSTTATPLFKIDTTTGSETVTIGKSGGDVYIGDVGSASNLIFEESSTIHGQGGNTLTFGQSGDIINFAVATGFGTTTPVSTVSIQGSLCVRDTGSCGTTSGTIYATTAAISDIDLAENYQTNDDTISAGEIVALDYSVSESGYIKRADKNNISQVIGIVSTNPGVLLGKEIPNAKPVALAGRVPLKVNLEGGEIKVGDRIALSSVAGVGSRATTTGQTVAIALQGHESISASSTIEVFISLEKYVAPNQLAIDGNGNVGIGTTTPDYTLHVIGDIAGNSFINTSTRGSKTDITYLKDEDYVGFLDKLNDINIATYRYNTDDQTLPVNRMGLIAEEAPSEVLSASQNGVDIYKLASFNLGITKVLSNKLADLELRVKNVEELRGTGGGISMNAVLDGLRDLGANIASGIASFKNLIVENLTIGSREKPSGITLYDEVTGDPYCLKVANGQTLTIQGTCPLISTSTSGTSTSTPTVTDPNLDTEPPVITINGNNPATIQKGQSYIDLGALVTDNAHDNLGITTTGDQIDTTVPGTYTVTYTATDQAGNTSTAERTVIVEDPSQPQPEPEEPMPQPDQEPPIPPEPNTQPTEEPTPEETTPTEPIQVTETPQDVGTTTGN